jgi:hypothetical protein
VYAENVPDDLTEAVPSDCLTLERTIESGVNSPDLISGVVVWGRNNFEQSIARGQVPASVVSTRCPHPAVECKSQQSLPFARNDNCCNYKAIAPAGGVE